MKKGIIRRLEIPKEYGFSLSTIDRWRAEGRISPIMAGRHRAYYRRSDLDRVIWGSKEKVGACGTDEEIGREREESQIRCKDTISSSDKQVTTQSSSSE